MTIGGYNSFQHEIDYRFILEERVKVTDLPVGE